MRAQRDPARSILDDVVCHGVAIDVFKADEARRLLEELDPYVDDINAKGLGKAFIASLQLILAWHLYLSLTRIFEPYSPRNPGRSIMAAIQHIEKHAGELMIINREPLVTFLSARGDSHDTLSRLPDKEVSLKLVEHFGQIIPKPDSQSNRQLDQALKNLRKVRDKAIAHHDCVEHASLMVPSGPKIRELIALAQQFVVLVARSYLNVHHDFERDTRRSAASLRRLLDRAGLAPRAAPPDHDIA